MSLNTAHANGGVLIFSVERILIFSDGVEMSFDMPGHIAEFKGKKKGRAYLTTHRVIFNTKDNKDKLQSFSMPFRTMKGVELEQPVFGANYMKGNVKAEADGNWEGEGKWKMWFNSGGCIDFGRAMLKAGEMATRHRQEVASAPPAYTQPAYPYYQAPPPAYSPPQDPAYGFVPYQAFPTPPPANSVYMMGAPPPYPGVTPNLPPYPVPQAETNGHATNSEASKAAEAAASGGNAYYNPQAPHNVYMPPPSYPSGEAPPPYSEQKKTQ